MANLGGNFNANAVEPASGFEILQPGQYVAMMTESEVAPTKSGDGQLLKCTFEVCEGPNKGAKLFARLNLWNKSAQAAEIAQKEFSAMCHAVLSQAEREAVSDSSMLHNKPMLLTVGVESYQKNDGTQGNSNTIKRYEPLSAGNKPIVATGVAANTATVAAPAAGFGAAPAAATAAPAAAASKPAWAR